MRILFPILFFVAFLLQGPNVMAQQPARVLPSFAGGNDALSAYINQGIRYQPETRGIKGKLLVSFDVKADSSLSAVTIVTGLHPGIDEQVIRLLERARFIPAEKNGKTIRMNMMTEVVVSESAEK